MTSHQQFCRYSRLRNTSISVPTYLATGPRSILSSALKPDHTIGEQACGLFSRVLHQQSNHSVGRQIGTKRTHCCAIVSVSPEIAHAVLSSCSDPWRLCQVKHHCGGFVQGVKLRKAS